MGSAMRPPSYWPSPVQHTHIFSVITSIHAGLSPTASARFLSSRLFTLANMAADISIRSRGTHAHTHTHITYTHTQRSGIL